MKILIIEDERHAQLELIRLLSIIDHDFIIEACCDTIKESVSWLETNAADLIFMDIQLSDGSGFEIFSRVQVKAPVIFVTAYDEFAIQAFKVNSVDYLLKPLDENALITALEKFQRQYTEKEPVLPVLNTELVERILSSLGKNTYKSRFMVSLGDKIRYIAVAEIAFFQADGNTLYLITSDSSKYIINYKLDDLTELLDPALFFRLNRTYTASISAIKDVRRYFNSRLKIYLEPATETEVLISRMRMPDFLKWMDN